MCLTQIYISTSHSRHSSTGCIWILYRSITFTSYIHITHTYLIWRPSSFGLSTFLFTVEMRHNTIHTPHMIIHIRSWKNMKYDRYLGNLKAHNIIATIIILIIIIIHLRIKCIHILYQTPTNNRCFCMRVNASEYSYKTHTPQIERFKYPNVV